MEISRVYSFILINELLDLDKELISIYPGFVLRKASKDHIGLIKRSIRYLSSGFDHNPFENNTALSKGRYSYEKLKPSSFRYSIIEFNGFLTPPGFIEALILSNLRLNCLATFFNIFDTDDPEDEGTLGFQHYESRGFNLLIDTYQNLSSKITAKYLRKPPKQHEIKDFQGVYESLKNLQGKAEFNVIIKSAEDFVKIKDISVDSPFRTLSYISILELLLTVAPKNSNDTSITKQLSKKIKFLATNYIKDLDFTEYFLGPDTNTIETIMKKLYEYRSDIAHGNFPDFNKDLKIISDNLENVLPFLDFLVRKLIRFGIFYPSILIGLKEI